MARQAEAMGYRYFKDDIGRYFALIPRRTLRNMVRLWVYTPGLWVLLFYRVGRSLGHAQTRHKILWPLRAVYEFFCFVLKQAESRNV